MPPTVRAPCLLRFLVSHLTQESPAGGGERASPSSAKGPGSALPSPWRTLPSPSATHASRSLPLRAPTSPNAGMGANGLLLWAPTLSSTLPFPFPE
jgi:hypothetical protein